MSHATTILNFTDAVITITDDGGNSATIDGQIGTASFANLQPAGRESGVYQSRGTTTGVRAEGRAYPTLSIDCQVARLDPAAFQMLMGVLAGFVSTTAAIGDRPTVDVQIDRSYKTDTRISLWDDCLLMEGLSLDVPEGGAGMISIPLQVLGKVVIDGITYVPSL